MKTERQIIRILAAALIIMLAWACKPGQVPPISDALISGSVAAGTSVALKTIPALKDHPDKQHVVAQYLNTYASALRTITGNPTDEQLTAQLMAFVPPDIQSQYPEISAFAVPMIVSFYDWAKARYGADSADFRRVVGDVASGLESGSACCLH